MPSEILYQNIKKFVKKTYNKYRGGLQHGTSPVV